MGQPDEDSRATDRAARAELVMDAVQAAAGSANPVVEVIAPTVAGERWVGVVPLTFEIRITSLPGGMVTAFPIDPSGLRAGTVGPPLLFDPADPQAGLALVGDVERLVAGVCGDHVAPWQVRAPSSGGSPGLPTDEPWLEGPSPSAVLKRLKAVRTGRGGEVAVAIVEAPRWVMRLSVGGRPRNLQVRGRLIDRLAVVVGDRGTRYSGGRYSLADGPPRWRGGWRLQGDFPDASRMLKEITDAILAQTPEPASIGQPTIAVRLEQSASASSAAESPTGVVENLFFGAPVLAFALALVVAPTTGFFALVNLDEGASGWLLGGIVIFFVTTVLTIPAWVAGDVANVIADRLQVRWSAKSWIRRAAVVGTYAALFVAISLVPYWVAVLALSVCGAIGLGLLKRRHH